MNSTLAQNQDTVDQVATGLRRKALIEAQFNSVTGMEAVGPNIRSQIYLRPTYDVGAVIPHDPYSPRGFQVLTAFPSNKR